MKQLQRKIAVDAELMQRLVDFHLKMAVQWAEQLAETATPHDKKKIAQSFFHQCEITAVRFKARMERSLW